MMRPRCMMALILWFKEKPPRTIECPAGARPDNLAEEHGALIWDLCDSIHEANFRLSSAPTGCMFPL